MAAVTSPICALASPNVPKSSTVTTNADEMGFWLVIPCEMPFTIVKRKTSNTATMRKKTSACITTEPVTMTPVAQNATHATSRPTLVFFHSSCGAADASFCAAFTRRTASMRMSVTSSAAPPMIMPSAMMNVILRTGDVGSSHPMLTK